MANGDVVDELVVKLRLDTSEYKKADKEVDGLVDKTEKKRVQDDAKRKTRETAQIKRTKDSTAATKGLAFALRGLAAGMATVLGVGSLGGLVGAVTMLAGYETNLRRAAVSTNLSNRELQAWGSTARRLGADAQAGAAAIGDLAKEQQQFNLTGQAPTMQALARLGVNVGPDVSIGDMLGQAQKIYRSSAPAQQKQIESGLAAQGVSADLIVMIKSETDARAAYAKSFAESSEENRKALDAVTDALVSLSNNAIAVANSIATVVQPAVEDFARYIGGATKELAKWNDRIIAAGGGVEGFTKVMTEDFPRDVKEVTTAFRTLGEAVDIIAAALNYLADKLHITPKNATESGAELGKKLGTDRFGPWLAQKWNELVGDARKNGPAPVQSLMNKPGPQPAATGPAAVSSAQDIMSKLVTQYGLTVPQAAAVAANMGSESGFNPAAFNPAGGGTGARGLAQWRGNRTKAFKERFGILPDAATVDQQLEFMFKDPYESELLKRVLGANGGADALGREFSTVFEGHGNAAETLRRGQEAARLAQSFPGAAGAAGGAQPGTNINIQTVTVQANNPGEFVGGIQRIAGPQNYNSAVR